MTSTSGRLGCGRPRRRGGRRHDGARGGGSPAGEGTVILEASAQTNRPSMQDTFSMPVRGQQRAGAPAWYAIPLQPALWDGGVDVVRQWGRIADGPNSLRCRNTFTCFRPSTSPGPAVVPRWIQADR
jgi:hypothetical protein